MNHEEQTKRRIKVVVNKEEKTFDEGTTIKDVLESRDITSRVAVWVNGKQLLIAEYPTYKVNDGDMIKVLRVVAGG